MNSTIIYWWPKGNKLIFLGEKATPEYWDQKWQSEDWVKQITRSRNSRYWSGILKKYLPDKNSRILEAGCGDGHLVDAMKYWGYDAIGIDFASETVKKIKANMPGLDVRNGDVRRLEFPDGSFDGLFSLGVIEHFWDGYHQVVSEMYRVVKPGGYIFLAFPCISIRDRIRIFLSNAKEFTETEMPTNFFQFALKPESVKRDFEAVGFQSIDIWHIDGLLGLARYSVVFQHLFDFLVELREKSRMARFFTAGLNRALAPFCGHGTFLVFKKQ